jgi:chitodextrinase
MYPTRIGWIVLVAALTTLASSAYAQTTPTSVQLTWTAPGDDGPVGTATQYDLRYSTAAITAANFAAATAWTSMPAPAASGTSQTVTVTGLASSTTYYFALKAQDDSGNWAAISNVASRTTLVAPDLTRPAPIALSVSSRTDTTATLGWTAVGDDSLTGTATSYDVRYSRTPITSANWAAATTVTGEPAPAAPGTAQTYTVRGLLRQTAYYFAVKTSDEGGNVSDLSNVPTTTTTDTMPPSVINNLTANFVGFAWHAGGPKESR